MAEDNSAPVVTVLGDLSAARRVHLPQGMRVEMLAADDATTAEVVAVQLPLLVEVRPSQILVALGLC